MITLVTVITGVDIKWCPGVHVGIKEAEVLISDGADFFPAILSVSTPGSSGAETQDLGQGYCKN